MIDLDNSHFQSRIKKLDWSSNSILNDDEYNIRSCSHAQVNSRETNKKPSQFDFISRPNWDHGNHKPLSLLIF